MAKLTQIKGLTKTVANKFRRNGIRGVNTFLNTCATLKERRFYAKKVGVTPSKILGWVNRADLFRIKGVGEQYSDLLEKSGVDTVKELSKRSPKALFNTLQSVNDKKHIVRVMPSFKAVNRWVSQAKRLKKVVNY